MPVCAVDIFWGELNIAAPMSSWPRPRQFSRGQILIMGPVKKISQWNLACLLHKYSETSKPNFWGNTKFFLVHWPLEMYSNSMCRQPAPVCPAMGEIRHNTTGNRWQNEKLLEMHQNQANLFENMHFHHHWSSQLRTVNDVSVWISGGSSAVFVLTLGQLILLCHTYVQTKFSSDICSNGGNIKQNSFCHFPLVGCGKHQSKHWISKCFRVNKTILIHHELPQTQWPYTCLP